MKRVEYRVVWERTTPWDDEDGTPIYGEQKWRIYQRLHAAKRCLSFLTIPCGKCHMCAPDDQNLWNPIPRCAASGDVRGWIEEREVGEWHEAG